MADWRRHIKNRKINPAHRTKPRTDDYCLCCDCGIKIEDEEPACCTICSEKYFCEKCARKYTEFSDTLECNQCSFEMEEHFADNYDESVEQEHLGYREGDRDIYDTRDDTGSP